MDEEDAFKTSDEVIWKTNADGRKRLASVQDAANEPVAVVVQLQWTQTIIPSIENLRLQAHENMGTGNILQP